MTSEYCGNFHTTNACSEPKTSQYMYTWFFYKLFQLPIKIKNMHRKSKAACYTSMKITEMNSFGLWEGI